MNGAAADARRAFGAKCVSIVAPLTLSARSRPARAAFGRRRLHRAGEIRIEMHNSCG
jgi:hypothetical protein